MRLSDILWRYKKALPGGHIWRGKYRLYKTVTKTHLVRLKQQFDMEEKNMFYLRHPYLTAEQSYGHATALNKPTKFIEKKINEKQWQNHRYLGDRFGFLYVTDKWE